MLENFILKEGFKLITTTLVISVLLDFFISDFLAIIGYLIAIFLIYIYRNTNCKTLDANIVSPISGKIMAIDIVNNEKLLYIEKSLCSPSILRAPKTGILSLEKERFGINLDASKYRAKKLNTLKSFKISDLAITLLSSICTTTNSIDENRNYEQGEKIGVFTYGQVILQIKDLNSNIKIGSTLVSGETVLN